MEDLAVQQREIRVKLHLQDGRDLIGTMFVPMVGPYGEPAHLIGRLNEESEEFVALRQDNRTHLIRGSRILTVDLDDQVEERIEQAIEENPRSRHLLVKMHLTSGAELIGDLYYVQPEEQRRLQDFLNTRRRFLSLRVEGRLVYVNRRQIVSVFALSGE